MKQLFIISLLSLVSSQGITQDLDSILNTSQVLELKISTPQPRLKEKFQITLDENYIRAHIFKTALDKIQPTDDFGSTDVGLMTLNVNAIKKGKNEIGPLQFELNGVKYSTNKIMFEVIDALPNVDKGLWFRKVITSDSTFCIIIEQRIPANRKTTAISSTETKYSTEPINNDIASFQNSYSIEGLDGTNSSSYTDFDSFNDENGEQKQFMRGYSINFFRIKDKKRKIVITKDKFQNIPADYKFEDILIQ